MARPDRQRSPFGGRRALGPSPVAAGPFVRLALLRAGSAWARRSVLSLTLSAESLVAAVCARAPRRGDHTR
eukprot:4597339-Prymnesium_polylepis.1